MPRPHRPTRGRTRMALALVTASAVVAGSCRGVTSREYEYDEDIYLALDGSATVYVNASVPALVALRGVDLNVDPRSRLDRRDVRAFFESPVTRVLSTTTSRRDNRRYVHLRIAVDDVTRLGEAPPFAWARYQLRRGDQIVFTQEVGASEGRPVGDVGWNGEEMVAFRLHLPSRVPFHNAPSREIGRGNIIVWEQSLTDRLQSRPVSIEVHLETASILARTLTLFGITIVLALGTLALVVWVVMRRGRGAPPGPGEWPPAAA
ncbi:MAG: hypothetical protein ACT4QD_07965 [Acidobacteriota bacterium]